MQINQPMFNTKSSGLELNLQTLIDMFCRHPGDKINLFIEILTNQSFGNDGILSSIENSSWNFPMLYLGVYNAIPEFDERIQIACKFRGPEFYNTLKTIVYLKDAKLLYNYLLRSSKVKGADDRCQLLLFIWKNEVFSDLQISKFFENIEIEDDIDVFKCFFKDPQFDESKRKIILPLAACAILTEIKCNNFSKRLNTSPGLNFTMEKELGKALQLNSFHQNTFLKGNSEIKLAEEKNLLSFSDLKIKYESKVADNINLSRKNVEIEENFLRQIKSLTEKNLKLSNELRVAKDANEKLKSTKVAILAQKNNMANKVINLKNKNDQLNIDFQKVIAENHQLKNAMPSQENKFQTILDEMKNKLGELENRHLLLQNKQSDTLALCNKIEDCFVDPISLERIETIVTCQEGHTFDEKAIKTWLVNKEVNPLTRNPLKVVNLHSNFLLNEISALSQEINNLNK